MADRKASPQTMLFRNADGKVIEIPSDQYMPSTRAWPDIVMEGSPQGGVVTARMLNDPAKTRAMEIAKAKAAMTSSLSQMGASNPATMWSDDDFLRLLALQQPLDRPRTQADVDEERRLKEKLAASTAEMQLQPQGFKAYPGEQKLTPARIAQMYGESPDTDRQIQELNASKPARLATAANLAAEGAASEGLYPSSEERGAGIQRALEIANERANEPGQGMYRERGPLVDLQRSGVDRVETSENEPQLDPNIVGPTAGGALVQGSPPSQGGAAGAGRSSLPMMVGPNTSNMLGFSGGSYTPGTSWDRSSALNSPFSFSTAARGTSPAWSAAARTEEERPASRPVSAPSRSAAAAPATRAAPQASSDTSSDSGSSSFSPIKNFFSSPASTKQLFQQSQEDPSDAGAWMRAERQYAKTHRDDPSFDVTKLDDSGMKRGGTAKSGGAHSKDAALHKALDIIHAMMTRAR